MPVKTLGPFPGAAYLSPAIVALIHSLFFIGHMMWFKVVSPCWGNGYCYSVKGANEVVEELVSKFALESEESSELRGQTPLSSN